MTAATRAGRPGRSCTATRRPRRSREIAARDGIDLAASYAYSDSASDVPMLEMVGHPVAVNPDAELSEIARVLGGR